MIRFLRPLSICNTLKADSYWGETGIVILSSRLNILQLPPHYTLIPIRRFLFAVKKRKSFTNPTLPIFWKRITFSLVINPEFKTAARANDVRRTSEFVIRRFFQFVVPANWADVSCGCMPCHKTSNNYNHSKLPFPAPTSKWYFAIPRSRCA